jgi:flagellar biogenesis protein FliO
VIVEVKTVLVDPKPAWGGLVVAIIAVVLFVVFATWIVIQRIRNGRDGSGE